MKVYRKEVVVGLTLATLILASGLVFGGHDIETSIKGWEEDSNYNELYDPTERAKIKGVVMDIRNVTPLPGMAPGVALLVGSSKDGTVSVHLGPRAFLDLNSLWSLRGNEVRIRGCWVEIEGENVFIASKLKNRSYLLKLRRTRDGVPHWTLSPEELAREGALE